MITATDIKVEGIGSGKKIRGRRHRNWRPDLITLDDVENDENVNTPEQRRKLASWYYKAVSKAGDTYTDIVYIGTILHFDSLLSKVLKNAEYDAVTYRAIISPAVHTDLWDAWELVYTDLENPRRKELAKEFFEENREAMLEGTEVLWPEKLTYYCPHGHQGIRRVRRPSTPSCRTNPHRPGQLRLQPGVVEFWDDDAAGLYIPRICPLCRQRPLCWAKTGTRIPAP